MSADTWTLKLQLALHTMASASPDTESRLHYAILHKGLEHLQILVPAGGSGTSLPHIPMGDQIFALETFLSCGRRGLKKNCAFLL